MAAAGKRVLIIEDDHKTAEIVRLYLERDGYQVTSVHDGREGLEAVRAEPPDLVILDLMLPGMSGLDVCRSVRGESQVPIIVLTALSTEQDKLAGLGLGADDYVTKPFSPRELAARVKVVLRRGSVGALGGAADDIRPPLTYRELVLDLDRHTATVGQVEAHLTPTELRILAVFMAEPGRLFSRGQLVEKALGYDYDGMDRTVDVHILNLRRKIESDPNSPEYIRTVYGIGYKLGA